MYVDSFDPASLLKYLGSDVAVDGDEKRVMVVVGLGVCRFADQKRRGWQIVCQLVGKEDRNCELDVALSRLTFLGDDDGLPKVSIFG